MELESEKLSLFVKQRPERPAPAATARSGSIESYGLRPYQLEAVEAILADFEEYRSTLLVMATGTGKTQTFVVAADQYHAQGGGRILVLAHRRELIDQAERRFQQLTGLTTGVEMAERTVLGQPLPTVVVASVQTLQSRIHAFDPADFGFLIVDESHHALADSYQLPMEYFRDAKLLGVTATPDRLDKQHLGKIFEHVAYVYDLRQAVEGKYLVPILQQQVIVDGMDFSKVRTTAGDLNESDLEKILTEEAHLHGVAVPTLELAKDRQTLVFCVTVNHAKLMAEMLNRYRPGIAKALDGKSSTEERAMVLTDFSEGRLQVLCNCQLFIEGVDIPSCSCIAMARPTKSRALYSQAVGRGTRLHPGKADLLVLDFVGNSGRHQLVTAVDIYGKEQDTEVADEVAHMIEQADTAVDILAVHDKASETVAARRRETEMERQQELLKMQELMASRQHIQVEVRYRGSVADPFSWAGISAQEKWGDFDQGPSEDLALFLKKHGLNPANFNAAQGVRMRKAIQQRVIRGLCTYKQTKALWKYGIDASTWPFQRASAALTAIAESHWRPSPELITSLTAD